MSDELLLSHKNIAVIGLIEAQWLTWNLICTVGKEDIFPEAKIIHFLNDYLQLHLGKLKKKFAKFPPRSNQTKFFIDKGKVQIAPLT